MKLWRHAVITYLRLALKTGILKTDLGELELRDLLADKYEVDWHVDMQERISKRHFLGYAARYIRRPPIAQHRFRKVDGPTVKFVTKDTVTKEVALDEIPREEFIQILADHVPDKYCHSIRYYGLLAPRARNRVFTILHLVLGRRRRPRPRPLSWAELIRKSFGRDPLIDSRGPPDAPTGVVPVSIVAAYPSTSSAEKEWVPNEDTKSRESLTIALAHQFLVPESKGRTDLELLKEAVDLTDELDFRKKRQQLYDWQEDVIRNGLSNAKALEEMAQYVDEYKEATKKAVGNVYTKFAFTLVPIAITALSGPLAPAVGAGAIANLVRFWIFDRKPVVQAGKSEAAAMFHTIQEELGWRTATI